MGRNAFVERYDRPNYKLHVIIFLAITGVSILLATQVEKNRGKADIAALKAPVPIDSIAIETKTTSEQISPSITPPVAVTSVAAAVNSTPINEAKTLEIALNTENSSQEYSFDDSSNLDNFDAPRIAMDSSAGNEGFESETIDAVSVTDQATEAVNDVAENDAESLIKSPPNTDQVAKSVVSLDQVIQQQHDRFLQTLAKSAEVEKKESEEIKQLKEAIRSDKPLAAGKKSSVNASPQDSNNISEKSVAESNPEHSTSKLPRSVIKSNAVQPVANVQPVGRQLTYNDTPELATIEKRLTSTEGIVMTKGELDRVVKQFTKSYNAGDINRLMALFAENASTNDQQSKLGIKADYAELFSNTKSRTLMINDINWQLGKGKAEGAAEFVVTVQPNNGLEENSFRGQIKITAIKHSRGVYITRLLHELKQ